MPAAHDPAVKAAVIADLAQGHSVRRTAKKFDLPMGTVSSWSAELQRSDQIQAIKKELGALILDYVRENLVTLTEQARYFRERSFLDRSDAQALAYVHGISADKVVRILEQIAPTDDDAADGTDAPPD